jgi:hypothetical protein
MMARTITRPTRNSFQVPGVVPIQITGLVVAGSSRQM